MTTEIQAAHQRNPDKNRLFHERNEPNLCLSAWSAILPLNTDNKSFESENSGKKFNYIFIS